MLFSQKGFLNKSSQMVLLANQCDYGWVNENVGQLEYWLKHGSPEGLYLNVFLLMQLVYVLNHCTENPPGFKYCSPPPKKKHNYPSHKTLQICVFPSEPFIKAIK